MDKKESRLIIQFMRRFSFSFSHYLFIPPKVSGCKSDIALGSSGFKKSRNVIDKFKVYMV